jgi:hypothetical protein
MGTATIDEFRAQLISDRARVQEGGPPVITAGLEDWYPGPLSSDRFWPSLLGDFKAASWPDERIETVDRASTKVVAHTPRPDRSAWAAKGLVVGYVQSGKTTNFTSVVAKLADVDYRLVIVLSGIHNGLRRQTQVRLDQQLKDLNPGSWLTLTDELRDFHAPTANASAFLNQQDKIVLAVVKKNVTVLRRLIRWLSTADARQSLREARVAVIDDEADQATVATARINPLIRKLLQLMPKCTYIGYTATPFANVFIDPTADDLYPKDFILNLPRPEGYFGPETIFGREVAEGEEPGDAHNGFDMIRRIPDHDIDLLRPRGRAASDGFVPTITEEVQRAVRWFVLATATRRARQDLGHSTMLIHTSVKTDVHEAFKDPLTGLLSSLREEVTRGDLDTFAELWESESSRVPATAWSREQNSFEEVAAHLNTVLDATRIVLDNSRSQDRLTYGSEPVVAIAVGGNTLSRGLTLEGLLCSLFVRGASAYDTLLQMGRWFGYRTDYEDLPRIWMTAELEDAFRHLASVEHDMRVDIEAYQLQSRTPLEVAVRIRTHPSLQITSKMGAARAAYISFAGRRLQTRYFKQADPDWLANNRNAAETLVEDGRRYGSHESVGNHELFRQVPVAAITKFLRSYNIHEDSPDLDTVMMTSYIDGRLAADNPSLDRWSVAVISGDGPDVALGGLTVGSSIRSKVNEDGERADIKTLMSKRDRALDLRLPAGELAGMSEAQLVVRRNEDAEHATQGLVVIYAIDKISAPALSRSGHQHRYPMDAVDTVIGVGVVFPGDPDSKNGIQPRYVAVDLDDVEVEDFSVEIEEDTEDAQP